MEKNEIIQQMKHHLAEYTRLKDELAALEAPQKRIEFEKKQRTRFETFKSKYTVEANMNGEFKPIDWEYVEKMVFAENNFETQMAANEGYMLGYDVTTGMAGLGVSTYDGGTFTPYAYDEADAKRYVELETRRRKLAEKSRR